MPKKQKPTKAWEEMPPQMKRRMAISADEYRADIGESKPKKRPKK